MPTASAEACGVRRNVGASLVQLGAAALLIIAATTMPWSMYKSTLPETKTAFHSGRLGVFLVVLGSTSVALAVAFLARPSRTLQRAQLVVGIVATATSIVLALRKIRAANHVLVMGGGQTSYAVGAVVAVLASAAIAVAAFVALARIKRENANAAVE